MLAVPAIGHEMFGTISDLGLDIRGWQVGDRVTVVQLDSCGEYPACRVGLVFAACGGFTPAPGFGMPAWPRAQRTTSPKPNP